MFLVALLLLLLSLHVPAWSQVARNLATNHDGSVLYFDSNARPVGSRSHLHSKIFRWTATDGIQIAHEVAREPLDNNDDQRFYTCRETNFYALHSPQVGASGDLAGFTALADLFPVKGCDTYYHELQQAVAGDRTLPGAVTLAPGGNWAITVDNTARNSGFHWVTQLPDGEPLPIIGTFTGGSHRITRDGRTVTAINASILLAGPDGTTRLFPVLYPVNDVAIDPEGRTIAFTTGQQPGTPAYLGFIDVATGRRQTLATGFDFSHVHVAGEGQRIYAIGQHVGGLARGSGLFHTDRSGSGPFLITDLVSSSSTRSFTVSGDGKAAFVQTVSRGLFRTDLLTGETIVILPHTPHLENPPKTLASGDPLNIFSASNLTRTTVCGQPASILGVPGFTRILTPYGLEGTCEVILHSADSPLETGFVTEFRTLLPAFTGIRAPIVAGQHAKFSLTGLGPHDGQSLLSPGLTCRIGTTSLSIDSVGPAPNQPGYYFLDILLPQNAGPVLTCGWNLDGPREDWIYAEYRLP